MFDQIRGAGLLLSSSQNYYPSQYGPDGNTPESAHGSVKTFNSDGFTLQTGATSYNKVNLSAKTYVGWAWDAGTAAVTASTDGSITPTAQWVNATAGFSITKYAGTGANASVGHGLSTAPEMVLIKNIDSATNWKCII